MSLRPTLRPAASPMRATMPRVRQSQPHKAPTRRPQAPQAALEPGVASVAPTTPRLLPKALEAAFSRNPRVGADFLGVALWQGQSTAHVTRHLTQVQQKIFHQELAQKHFTGKQGEVAYVPLTVHDRLMRVMLVGLGQPFGTACVDAGKRVVQQARRAGAEHVVVVPPQPWGPNVDSMALTHLVRGLQLGSYSYTACFSHAAPVAAQRVAVAHPRGGKGHEAALRGLALADATVIARDLVNTPANQLTPKIFAETAAHIAERYDLTCDILDEKAIEAQGMHLIRAVGGASEHPPRLVRLSYRPEGVDADAAPDIALVGKGITFDSGGLCIKPGARMLGMKADMGGAAAVLGAVVGAAQMRVDVKVDAILALAENSVGSKAYRPGDVYTSAAGKTVEIIDTDAEGRLVLADALHYAHTLGASEIVDVATLTGACIVALGHATAGLFANESHLASRLLQAGNSVGESLWHLPLSPSLEPEIRSRIADLKNLGGGGGGAITAALFLREFVGDARWAHLDIAGPATHEEGATGFAAATLAEYLRLR